MRYIQLQRIFNFIFVLFIIHLVSVLISSIYVELDLIIKLFGMQKVKSDIEVGDKSTNQKEDFTSTSTTNLINPFLFDEAYWILNEGEWDQTPLHKTRAGQ